MTIFRITLIVSVCAVLFWVVPTEAAERINRYDVTVGIKSDASIDVVETIAYDFGEDDQHGIIRDIPYKYETRGATYALRMSDFTVADEYGIEQPFDISTIGHNKSIKIGDPDELVSGQKTYVIRYSVKRAMSFFDTHDELYWNAIGDAWDVPIGASEVRVLLPSAVPQGVIQNDCYTGPFGVTETCEKVAMSADNQTLIFEQSHLAPGNALTVVVGLPKGIILEPTEIGKMKEFVRDNWAVVLPILTFVACFFAWYKRGRDAKGRGTIIPEFDVPDQLMPGQVGTIVDGKASHREFTAELIELAKRGYLTITREEEKKILKDMVDYVIEQQKAPGSDLRPYQVMILEKLFSYAGAKEGYDSATPGSFVKQRVRLSKLKQKFFEDFGKIVKAVSDDVTSLGYFKVDPSKARSVPLIMGIIVIAASFFFMEIFVVTGVSLLVSGIIIMIFGIFMDALSEKGALAKEHILGLKMYLSVAEKDRLAFHNSPVSVPTAVGTTAGKPEKTQYQFEQFLPVAIALGVEKQWAKQFADMSMQPPSWYHTSSGLNGWTALVLADELGGFQKTAMHNLAMPAGKSGLGGGGFSGGGFGGGGGRSW